MMRLPYKLLLTLLLCTLQAAACTAFADLDAVEKQDPVGGGNNTACVSDCTKKGDERCAGAGSEVESCQEVAGCLVWQPDADESCPSHQICKVGDKPDKVECACADPNPCPTYDLTCDETDPRLRIVCAMEGREGDTCAIYKRDPCGEGDLCDTGQCITACTNDEVCGAGARCLNERCYAGCATNTDCSGDLCMDGICLAACGGGEAPCLSTESCVEAGATSRCEPMCTPLIAGQDEGAGFSLAETLALPSGAPSIALHLCPGSEGWFDLPSVNITNRVTISLHGSNLEHLVLEAQAGVAATETLELTEPTAPGEPWTATWVVSAPGVARLRLQLDSMAEGVLGADVGISVTHANFCEGALPVVLPESLLSFPADDSTIDWSELMVCPGQERWFATRVNDRAELNLALAAGTNNAGLEVSIMQEIGAPLWTLQAGAAVKKVELRRLTAGPVFLRVKNTSANPRQFAGSLMLASASLNSCFDERTDNLTKRDAAWLRRGTSSAKVCSERPDVYKIDPSPAIDALLTDPTGGTPFTLHLQNAGAAQLEWSEDDLDESAWTSAGTMLNLLELRSDRSWRDNKPLFVRVNPSQGENVRSYNLTMTLNTRAALDDAERQDDAMRATEDQPTLLNAGTPLLDLLHEDKATDFFTIQPTSDAVRLLLKNDDSAVGALLVEVFDAAGSPVLNRLVESPEESLVFKAPARTSYLVRLTARATLDGDNHFLLHYELSLSGLSSCLDTSGALRDGIATDHWAEAGQDDFSGNPARFTGPRLCPLERATLEVDLQGLPEATALIRRLQDSALPLRWELVGPGCASGTERTLWSGSPGRAVDLTLSVRCGSPLSGNDLTPGTYSLRFFNPNATPVDLSAWIIEKRDFESGAGPCPETLEGPEHPFNDRLYSGAPTPEGQLLIPDVPVSGALGFCGIYQDPSDLYAFFVPTTTRTAHISFAWLGEPADTGVSWSLKNAQGVQVIDSRDDPNNSGYGASQLLPMLSAGWYTLEVQLPSETNNMVSGPEGVWYSVVLDGISASPSLPMCSADELTSFTPMLSFDPQDAEVETIQLIPEATEKTASMLLEAGACGFELDLLRVTTAPDHDIRAVLASPMAGNPPPMTLDFFGLPFATDRFLTAEDSDYLDRANSQAVVYWNDQDGQSDGYLLRAYTDGVSVAPYTLEVTALDCRDLDELTPNEFTPTEPLPADPMDPPTGNNSRATGRQLTLRPSGSVSHNAVLCNVSRDEVDWFKYQNSQDNNDVVLVATLVFKDMPSVRKLRMRVYRGSGDNDGLVMETPDMACGSNMRCVTTSFTCARGETCDVEVTRFAMGSGAEAGQEYTLTLQRQ